LRPDIRANSAAPPLRLPGATGILARGLDRDGLDAVLAEDPYTVGGVAEWDVRELSPSGGLPHGLAALTEAHPGG
jgi:hypothetical protein